LLLVAKEWLPGSRFEEAGKLVFEYYDDEQGDGEPRGV
jgi:hypothetical protein